MAPPNLLTVKLIALICLAVSVIWALYATYMMGDSPLHRAYYRYLAYLDRSLRVLFMNTRAAHILWGQVIGATLLVCAWLMLSQLWLLVLLVGVMLGPRLWLEQQRKQRVAQIELKLDNFVVALANALRASPSPGRALAMILPVTPAPFNQELDLVLREMRVGSTLEQALSNLSARVRSFQVDAVMTSLLIGRQTGGNVPEILDGAAETLREMARLQGMLRSKTAEQRAQVNVLAVAPLVLLFVFDRASPGFFLPLTESLAGYVVMTTAISMWLGSVLMARRIMAVQL
jgi:tight adherence protein B